MKTFLLIALITFSFAAKAQDPEFSQYYAAPLYLNPAFTGTTMDHRFIANFRNQWPNVAQGYNTYAVSYDYNLHDLNSGFGIMAIQDQAGTAGMKSTEFNFLYSYKWNVSSKWVISSGLNFGYASRSIDFNKLIFADQLQIGNPTSPSSDPSLTNSGTSQYFDFKAGLLAYNKNFWLGFAANHLNEPNRSLINAEAYVPMKLTIHGGVRIPLYTGAFKRERIPVFSPSFVYKQQGNFQQLDVGAYLLYEPIIFGLWYRGIPVINNSANNPRRDAAVVILGFQLTRFEIVYSYDFTISELGPISGGAHELALKYRFEIATVSKGKKPYKFIPCPTFIRKE